MRMKMSTTRSIFRLLLMLTWYLAMSMTRMQCHREQPPDLVDVEPIGSRPATRHGEAATTQLKEGLTKASDLGMQAAEAAMDRGKETWNALKDRANHMKDTAKNSLAEKAESISRDSVYDTLLREMDHLLDGLKGLLRKSLPGGRKGLDLDTGDSEGALDAHTRWDLLDGCPSYEYQVYEDEDIVYLDMPGVERGEIVVRVTGANKLVVTAEHVTCLQPPPAPQSQGHRGREGEAAATERQASPRDLCVRRKNERSLRIPASVDRTRIKAFYKDGILIIQLPKILQHAQSIPIVDYPEGITDKIKKKLGISTP